jgi:hypothetical protein
VTTTNRKRPALKRRADGSYTSPSGRYRITAKRSETGRLLFWKVRDMQQPDRNLPPCHSLAQARDCYGLHIATTTSPE